MITINATTPTIIPIIKPVLLFPLLFEVVTVVVSSEFSLYKKLNDILSKFCPSETSKYIDNFSILDFVICILLFIDELPKLVKTGEELT